MELAARGVLTLVDHAAPARLREAYLRLRARDPATEVIVDVRRLAELSPGATAILALTAQVSNDALDWLNLTRPIVSELRLTVMLWCEDGAAAVLAQRAPDFFDWISARVDCPPAPAAHAVADVRRAICARASGIAWDGPGLEETLAAIRPGRPIRRVAVASYQSMIDALTSRERGWLFLEGIDTAFHLRRLRWAMAETGRRVIVFRRAFERAAPGWWTVHARHVSITEAVRALTAAGGMGRLAALAGLDPDACAYARFALRRGSEAARLEVLLATASDPRVALQDLAWQSGWTAADVIAQDDPQRELVTTRHAIEREVARRANEYDHSVWMLREGLIHEPASWIGLGIEMRGAGDFELAVRWSTEALGALPDDASPVDIAHILVERGQSYHSAGDLAAARMDLEQADSLARSAGDASTIALSAAALGATLLAQGDPSRARECMESALRASAALGDKLERALLLDMLSAALRALGDLTGARLHLDRALAIKRKDLATEDHPNIVRTLTALGGVLAEQGDLDGARAQLEHSLELSERYWGAEHPSVVPTLHGLARVHQAMADTDRACGYLERALEVQRVAFGSDEHPDVAETLVELARVIAAGGDLDGAQAMLERAFAIQQKVFGNDDPPVGAKTRRAFADVLVAKGDLSGAIGHLERALATLRKIFQRDDHPDIAATLRELERLQKLQAELQRTD